MSYKAHELHTKRLKEQDPGSEGDTETLLTHGAGASLSFYILFWFQKLWSLLFLPWHHEHSRDEAASPTRSHRCGRVTASQGQGGGGKQEVIVAESRAAESPVVHPSHKNSCCSNRRIYRRCNPSPPFPLKHLRFLDQPKPVAERQGKTSTRQQTLGEMRSKDFVQMWKGGKGMGTGGEFLSQSPGVAAAPISTWDGCLMSPKWVWPSSNVQLVSDHTSLRGSFQVCGRRTQHQACGCAFSASFFSFFFFPFIFISWRLITSQHFSGFCHILTWISLVSFFSPGWLIL